MNKAAKTYQTPAGAIDGADELPGALWYGTVYRHVQHEIAVIREEGGEVLVSGPTFYGWVRRDDVIRDAD